MMSEKSKATMKNICIAIALLQVIACLPCSSQDTVKVDPSIFYSSKTHPDRGKMFAATVKYGREDIIYSENKRTIDYCYYYDNERVCHGYSYEIIGDSVLKINDAVWNYKKQGDSYFLSRFFRDTYESGLASNLIPLTTAGTFITTTPGKSDTLWTTDYTAQDPSSPYSHPRFTLYRSPVKGKVYPARKVDEVPTFLNGDTIRAIRIKRSNDVCYGEHLVSRRNISLVITADGRIVNIKPEYEWSCPYYMLDVARHLSQLGRVNPARKDGKSVHVKWVIQVYSDYK